MNVVSRPLDVAERSAIADLLPAVAAVSPLTPPALRAVLGAAYLTAPRSPGEQAHQLSYARTVEALQPLQRFIHAEMRAPSPNVLVLQKLPDVDPTMLLLLIGSMVGEVREYRGHGNLVIQVSDKQDVRGGRPSSDNDLAFQLHTDMSFYPTPPAFVAFLMLSQAGEGGESLFCDPAAIAHALPAEALDALQRPFVFPPPPHQQDACEQLFPILQPDGVGGFAVRFRRDGLRAGDAEQHAALEAWQSAIDAAAIEVALRPSDMAVYSNTALLHGRRAFRDRPDRHARRNAYRAYVEF